MKPSQLREQHREAIKLIVEKRNGANPLGFGSIVRGEDAEDGDLDILIGDQPGKLVNLSDLGGNELRAQPASGY